MQTSRGILRAIAYSDFALSAALVAWGVFLVTSPLHPLPGDSHGGLMAVFPGLLLILLAALAYGSGKLLLRKHILGWVLQALVVVCLGLLVVMFFT